jgi:hypothetical protein
LCTPRPPVHKEDFDHYEEMQRDMEAKVIEEAKKKKAEAHATH